MNSILHETKERVLVDEEQRNKVVIVGAGEIGLALAKVLSEKEPADIFLWDNVEGKVPDQKPLADTIPSADFVFLCVPSRAVREAISSIKEMLPKEAVIVSLSKGFEVRTAKTMPEVLQELLPGHSWAVMGGPALAEEVSKGMGGIGIVAGPVSGALERLRSLFLGRSFIVEASSDFNGVALSGVLKNIYSIALGIADGLGWGWNMKGYLVSLATAEMGEVLRAAGGSPETALGPAALGDLVATGLSPYSRNRQVGYELAQTGKCAIQSEGFDSLPLASQLVKDRMSKFPLLEALGQVCISGQNAKEIFKQLIKNTR